MHLLSQLNLITDGKLNLVHALTYGFTINFLFTHDIFSLIPVVLCIGLLSIDLLKPKNAVQLSEVKNYQDAVDKVSKEVRILKLHVGLKQ